MSKKVSEGLSWGEKPLSDKSRRDRWMQLVVSCGLLLLLGGCGGVFFWLIHDSESTAPFPSDLAAQRQQQEREAQEGKRVRQTEDAKAREKMATFVRPWVSLANDSPVAKNPRSLQRRQKILIWDATTLASATANARLPASLRGTPSDGDLTLAVILQKRNVEVMTYELSPLLKSGNTVHGYRVEMDVALVDVVEKKALGRTSLVGDDPPQTIKRKTYTGLTIADARPEYGDVDGPLALWLEYRPHIGQPDRISEARQMVRECRNTGKVAPQLSGKLLIWDMAKDVPSSANQHLPDARRGTLNDRELTIILVAGREYLPQTFDEGLVRKLLDTKDPQMKGSVASLLAGADGRIFREQLELCLVSFPQKEALGTATVEGAFLVVSSPESQSNQSVVVGDSDKEVAHWTEGITALSGRKGH